MDKKSLAIFDLDGTLFDTGDVNFCAYRDSLISYGVTLDKEYFVTKCNGKHYTEFLPAIMGTSDYLEEVHKAKKKAYAANLDKARINAHLFQMINGIKDTYHIAIVTTASRKNTMDILNYFGYKDLFELFITQEDIVRVKPDPEGFLKAMEYFGIDAKDTIIFEDSEVGIKAARNTGASVVVVDRF